MILKNQMKKLFAVTFALVLVACLGSVALAEQPMLSVDDCAKCHAEQPAQIAANGASHKTEIDCQACHEGHRPSVAENIPSCSDCHEGSTHYEVDNCLGCHNPHQPLNVSLEGEHKKVCVSCHSGPDKQMTVSPSKHATFACNFCHADTHGTIPDCVECHEPHSATMAQSDCGTCHQAHKPLELTYPATTASQLCGACHDAVNATLAASEAKHSQISCATCHADKHMTVPECADCHGVPHAPAMHQRFPKCGECHNVAHDLNNWPPAKKK
jgi:predicted CXXCH cytochrome family protein